MVKVITPNPIILDPWQEVIAIHFPVDPAGVQYITTQVLLQAFSTNGPEDTGDDGIEYPLPPPPDVQAAGYSLGTAIKVSPTSPNVFYNGCAMFDAQGVLTGFDLPENNFAATKPVLPSEQSYGPYSVGGVAQNPITQFTWIPVAGAGHPLFPSFKAGQAVARITTSTLDGGFNKFWTGSGVRTHWTRFAGVVIFDTAVHTADVTCIGATLAGASFSPIGVRLDMGSDIHGRQELSCQTLLKRG